MAKPPGSPYLLVTVGASMVVPTADLVGSSGPLLAVVAVLVATGGLGSLADTTVVLLVAAILLALGVLLWIADRLILRLTAPRST